MRARSIVGGLLLAVFPETGLAQVGGGIEAQLYPAGTIFTLRGELELDRNDLLLGYLGGNYTDRRDWGEHADEDGIGPGFGAGWRHFLKPDHAGWHFGTRADLWFLRIDWDDPGRSGTTDVTVLQPTAVAGYTWQVGGNWVVDLNLGLGAEINVWTDGEEVGSGAIALIGAGTSFRF